MLMKMKFGFSAACAIPVTASSRRQQENLFAVCATSSVKTSRADATDDGTPPVSGVSGSILPDGAWQMEGYIAARSSP